MVNGWVAHHLARLANGQFPFTIHYSPGIPSPFTNRATRGALPHPPHLHLRLATHRLDDAAQEPRHLVGTHPARDPQFVRAAMGSILLAVMRAPAIRGSFHHNSASVDLKHEGFFEHGDLNNGGFETIRNTAHHTLSSSGRLVYWEKV